MSNVLQDIFKDHYEEMLYILHPRKSVIENVDRMINCGDPSFGGAMYGCAKCGTFKFIPFRCHNRFCPTCGTKYSIDRTTSMSFKIINTQHGTVFLPLILNSDISFWKTANSLAFFLMPFKVLFSGLSIKIINRNVLLPDLFLFSTLLVVS